MFKSIFLPLIAVAAFITVVGLLSQGKLDFLTKKLSVDDTSQLKSIQIGDVNIYVEVANTNEARSKGLSSRTNLKENNGMVFIFGENTKPTFWMKDTKIPLDIIWINDNKIVLINKNVEPEPNTNDVDLKRYPAPSEIDYVLEVNAGFSDKNNITAGSTVQRLSDL